MEETGQNKPGSTDLPEPTDSGARACYVTTPIYYVNDRPHIGHAYSTIAADLVVRYQSLRGRATRFLTGTDEHGQKVERRAKDEGLSPQEFVDRMAPPFRELPPLLHCEPHDFIRTTEKRHKRQAQELWRKLEEKGDIYLGEYEGWYSVSSEAFFTEKDLIDGKLDPITKKPVEKVKEKSYFFRLSDYGDKLLDFYEKHPDFVQPQARFNEVKSFVREGLRDLSISRTTFRWGVPVPKNPEHVMYVWLDALTNYLSALGYLDSSSEEGRLEASKFWEPNARVIHIVGKDILRFHAVYWPAFLMSAGIAPPSQVWAHGWLTVDGEKMAKSAGNFIPPEPLCELIGADVLRYYLMRDVAFGQDGDFSHEGLVARYQGDLGNGLGNLLNRVVASIAKKGLDSTVPKVSEESLEPLDKELIAKAKQVSEKAGVELEKISPHRALDVIWELVSETNRYVDQTAPWALLKEGKRERLEQVVYTVLESLRFLSIMLWPFMPEKCDDLRAQLGLPPLCPTKNLDLWPSVFGGLAPGLKLKPGTPLFPRLEEGQEAVLLGKKRKAATPAAKLTQNEAKQNGQSKKMSDTKAKKSDDTETGAGLIEWGEFDKVQLRLGEVCEAERVPKSDKLLRLQVDIGEPEARQILAGIGKHYAPEDLVGKRLVVVANLKPRKMMGLESRGMVLAVSDDDGLSPLFPDKAITAGVRAS